MKKSSTYFRILTCLLSWAVWIIFSTGCHSKSHFPMFVSFNSRTAPAIVRLAKRQSKTVVNLPPRFSNRSFTGRAYVTTSGDTLYVFVPSWVGHNEHYTNGDNWVEGYLYTSKPFVWRHGEGHFIDLNVPDFGKPSEARMDTRFQNIQMEVGDPIAKTWYQADSFG